LAVIAYPASAYVAPPYCIRGNAKHPAVCGPATSTPTSRTADDEARDHAFDDPLAPPLAFCDIERLKHSPIRLNPHWSAPCTLAQHVTAGRQYHAKSLTGKR
jgi:hypothetical protein